MIALAAALLLAQTPFPPPRLAPVTDRLKCDAGTVVAVEQAGAVVKVKAAAGLLVLKAGPDVQVFDAAGKPAGSPGGLVPGQAVRAWYQVEDGARAVEMALE